MFRIVQPSVAAPPVVVVAPIVVVVGYVRSFWWQAFASKLLRLPINVTTLNYWSTWSLGWRALKTPTSETPDFGGHMTPLRFQYLWPRPPGVWLGGPGCKQGWGQIRICICKYKYKYKYGVCICIWSNFKPCICICIWSTVFGVFDKYVFKYTFSCAFF